MTPYRFRRSRTALARFFIRWLPWPPSLLLAAWGWLAAEAEGLGEKRRCLEAILRLEPDNEQATMVLQQTSWDEPTTPHNRLTEAA